MSKRRRDKNKIHRLAQQVAPQPMPPASSPALNLDYLNASTVVTGDYQRVQIIVAGCGGIGAYVVQHVGRMMRLLYESNRGVNLSLVDPDVVEEKNLGRQLFCDAEVGEPKAVALARRYGQAWGLNTIAYVDEFSERFILNECELIILIGCVDNAAARAVLHERLADNPEQTTPHSLPRIWWLDCGNLKDTGRVMLGSAYNTSQLAGSFLERKQCIALPSPALQYPSLLIPEREETGDREMSCAELQMANLQSLNINAGIAVQAADMLTRLLITRDLKRYQCAVNLASGSVKSFYCTPDEIGREIGMPADFVVRESPQLQGVAA